MNPILDLESCNASLVRTIPIGGRPLEGTAFALLTDLQLGPGFLEIQVDPVFQLKIDTEYKEYGKKL